MRSGHLLFMSVYSLRTTLGTSMLWVEGDRSSSFLPVKIYTMTGNRRQPNLAPSREEAARVKVLTSVATRWTLA